VATKPDGKAAGAAQRVTFTRPAAERIAKAVRTVEGGNRSSSALEFVAAPGAPQLKTFRVGTYSGAWPIETDKTVTFYNQTSTPNTVTARNHFVDLQHGTCTATSWKCGIAKDGTAWKLVSWQQNTATAVFVANVTETVVLRDVLISFNTANCSIAKTNVTVSIVVIGTTFTNTMFTLPRC